MGPNKKKIDEYINEKIKILYLKTENTLAECLNKPCKFIFDFPEYLFFLSWKILYVFLKDFEIAAGYAAHKLPSNSNFLSLSELIKL